MKGLQLGLRMWIEEFGGGEQENRPTLLPQGSIPREGAGLTSDQWQLFPLALPATASPPTAPDIPQPSGPGTQTKGLQGAERWGNQ